MSGNNKNPRAAFNARMDRIAQGLGAKHGGEWSRVVDGGEGGKEKPKTLSQRQKDNESALASKVSANKANQPVLKKKIKKKRSSLLSGTGTTTLLGG